eukprot:Blabericola_migrator_1__168@NODE_1044_length_5617_cov_59_730991_g269_i1_p3_GENE_NODE_1044_length_5617_cov_59_730991_g269_i1NODE_1044_length_5617_cov_59_730991_g269_i1_p3_ORF_typecomplete_len352_score66_84DUF4801/PF16059_5/0_29_NODE_1044_length_5617_cov_59_730991_g269_i144785533
MSSPPMQAIETNGIDQCANARHVIENGYAKLLDDHASLRAKTNDTWTKMNQGHLDMAQECGSRVCKYGPKICDSLQAAKRSFKGYIKGPVTDCWIQRRSEHHTNRTHMEEAVAKCVLTARNDLTDVETSANRLLSRATTFSKQVLPLSKLDLLKYLRTTTLDKVPVLNKADAPLNVAALESILDQSGVPELVSKEGLEADLSDKLSHTALSAKHQVLLTLLAELFGQTKTKTEQSFKKPDSLPSTPQPFNSINKCVDSVAQDGDDPRIHLVSVFINNVLDEATVGSVLTCSKSWFTPRNRQPFWADAYSVLEGLRTPGDTSLRETEERSVESSRSSSSSHLSFKRLKKPKT